MKKQKEKKSKLENEINDKTKELTQIRELEAKILQDLSYNFNNYCQNKLENSS